MTPDRDSQDWQALWRAQERKSAAMKSEVACMKARAFEKKVKIQFWGVLVLLALFAAKAALNFFQFPEPWIRAGWGWGVVTFIYAAARWAHFGPPDPLQPAASSEQCLTFLRGQLEKKRARILEMRWILLLLFPALCASWWGGGPVAMAKRLGLEWPALLRFQESPGPLIGLAVLLAFVWVKFGAEARAIRREIETIDN